MKATKMLAILVLALGLMVWPAPIVHGAQYLTVNGQDVNSITLELGQSRTVEVVSTDSASYVAYVGFDNGLVLGTFSHLETKPEAGNLTTVLDYNQPAFYGYYVSASGFSPPPSAGAHFVFQYDALQLGETDLKLYDSTFASVIDSIHITVIPLKSVAMGTAFTYQGRLMDANKPADGLYDFKFKLYDNPDPVFAMQQGSSTDINDLDVIDGYFTVELDFGSGVFTGNARWLEIGVRPGELEDPNVYTTLSPRQEITPTPYALYSNDANTLDGQEASVFASASHDHDTRYYTKDTSDARFVNVNGDGMYGSGTLAVLSATNSGTGDGCIGIKGSATNSLWAENYGGYFEAAGSVGCGVYGEASGIYGAGVYGKATNITNYTNIGGRFEASGITGYGVYGKATGSDGIAVKAWATGANGIALYAQSDGNGPAGRFNGDVYVTGDVGIGTTIPAYRLDVEGYVQAHGYYTGDIVFQKDDKKLWRMFEDEDGLYLENLKTGKVYSFVLQETENKLDVNGEAGLDQAINALQAENHSLKERVEALERTIYQLAKATEVKL